LREAWLGSPVRGVLERDEIHSGLLDTWPPRFRSGQLIPCGALCFAEVIVADPARSPPPPSAGALMAIELGPGAALRRRSISMFWGERWACSRDDLAAAAEAYLCSVRHDGLRRCFHGLRMLVQEVLAGPVPQKARPRQSHLCETGVCRCLKVRPSPVAFSSAIGIAVGVD
jgi:hypothetical protein